MIICMFISQCMCVSLSIFVCLCPIVISSLEPRIHHMCSSCCSRVCDCECVCVSECVCTCVRASTRARITLYVLRRSVVSDSFVKPWTVAHQAHLSMGFSR